MEAEQMMNSYSIPSSTSLPDCFSMIVKRAPDSLFSMGLHGNIQLEHELAMHAGVYQFNSINWQTNKRLFRATCRVVFRGKIYG